MFYFYADKKGVLKQDRSGVLLNTRRLFPDLRSARAKKHKRILVVDTDALPDTPAGTKIAETSLYEALDKKKKERISVPIEAIRNITPYQSPLEIAAGGGVVTRVKGKGVQVLLIYRKGVWELPKGKLDKGETIEECAARETREEIGISKLKVLGPLDVTVHAYSENRRLKVKTTHWFQMSTPESNFKPEKREGITEVKWFSWKSARKAVAYKNLRNLLDRIKPLVDASS